MRRTAAVTAVVIGLCAPATAMAADSSIHDPARARLAKRLDAAGGTVSRIENFGISLHDLNGFPAIVVARDATLEDLSLSLPSLVRETKPGVWEIARTIFVVNDATLRLHTPRVRELRLLSSPGGFASLIGYNGSLSFRGGAGRKLLVHSWDPHRRAADRTLRDGRASVSVRRKGRLDALNTAFEDLGFYEGRVSGVAIVAPRWSGAGTGSFVSSRFARNWFGGYTYHARGVNWVGNEFVHNYEYGLDPHDDSDEFLVEGNYAAYNGKHGIIFSRDCDRNIIRRNIAEYNGWHGIVLDDGKKADGPSNGNRVYGNVIRGNRRVGVSVDGSSRNDIHGNNISGSRFGIRLFGPSRRNRARGNTISDASIAAIFVDHPSADNSVRANEIVRGWTGVRVRGAARTLIADNRIADVRSHGVKIEGDARWRPSGVAVRDNTIQGSGPSPILVDVPGNVRLELGPNTEDWNYPIAHDLARLLAWTVGPGLWLVLFGVALCGGLGFATVQRVRGWRRAIFVDRDRGSVIHAREISRTGSSEMRIPVDPRVNGSESANNVDVENGDPWVQVMKSLARALRRGELDV